MAATNITVQKLEKYNEPAVAKANTAMAEALDGAAGAKIKWDERDDKMLVLIQNTATSEQTATIKAGDGIMGVCDLSVTIAASSYTFVALDSARFKWVSGENKGHVLVTGASSIKVAAFKLP